VRAIGDLKYRYWVRCGVNQFVGKPKVKKSEISMSDAENLQRVWMDWKQAKGSTKERVSSAEIVAIRVEIRPVLGILLEWNSGSGGSPWGLGLSGERRRSSSSFLFGEAGSARGGVWGSFIVGLNSFERFLTVEFY
jgi:hypothetical protein